jgi:hypothetical protein
MEAAPRLRLSDQQRDEDEAGDEGRREQPDIVTGPELARRARESPLAGAAEAARVGGDGWPGKLHGKILNAAFTMFKTRKSARGSSRPGVGRRSCDDDGLRRGFAWIAMLASPPDWLC